jgi:hypothetical protein
MKQAYRCRVRGSLGLLTLAVLLTSPVAASADLCDDLLSECQSNAGTAYDDCINEVPINTTCEGTYNTSMNQCTADYYSCMGWGSGGCSPCSSTYYTNNLAFCDDPPTFDYCGCCVRGESPVLIDLNNDGFHFSDAQRGALFSINNGPRRRVGWPLAGDDAWLAWDRNKNGVIDNGRELFGTVTPSLFGVRFENGYEALKEWDANRDNVIDRRDPVFAHLRVWSDSNRNGLSERRELLSLQAAGVRSLDLNYNEARVRDEWGNRYRFWSRVGMSDGTERPSVDVFPVSIEGDPNPKE